MEVFFELLKTFFREKAGLFVFFLLLVLLMHPLETILVPHKAGKLAGIIKENLPTNEAKKKASISRIRKQIFTLLGLYVVTICMHMTLNLTLSNLIPRFKETVKNEIYERLIRKSESNFDEIPSGKVLFRIQRISNAMADFTYFILGSILPLMIVMLAVCVYMLKTNVKLGSACIVLVSVFFIAFFAFSKYVINVSEEVEAVHEKTVNAWQNKLSNMMNIVVTNSGAQETEDSAKAQRQDSDATRRKMKAESVFRTTFSTIGVVLFSVLALLSFREYKRGKILGPQFASVGIVSLMVSNMLGVIASKSPKYLSDMGLIKNSEGFLNSLWKPSGAPSEEDLEDLPPNDQIKGAIEFRGVSFSYPPPSDSVIPEPSSAPQHLVLENFDFSVKAGEKVAIFGTSGSGKTTIAKLLLGMKRPQSGTISLDGIDLVNAKRSHIRRAISMSNQHMTLFHGTILENIKYGLGNEIRDEEIESILETYALLDVFSKLEKGIRSEVGVDGKGVSHGMQKTVMNLRSLLRARTAPIVILDEPFAGLDEATRKSTGRLIVDHTKGKTVLIISHHPEISEIVDRVFDISKHARQSLSPSPSPSPRQTKKDVMRKETTLRGDGRWST